MRALPLIEDITVDHNAIKVRAGHVLATNYLREDFSAEYDVDIALDRLDYSIVTIPFVLNTVPIVWLSGREYYIRLPGRDLGHFP